MKMRMITKITREEEKQGGARDAQYYCSPSDKCSAPSLHPKQPPFQVTSPVYLSGMTSCSVQYPFGCFGSRVLAMLLHSIFF